MLVQQHTIKKVTMTGVGLHTGVQTTMTFQPAPENYGIRFRRIDVGGNPEVPADVDHVIGVERGTTIGIGDVRVHTVEHVLAAIVGLQVDNVIIDLDNIEPPIADGSSRPFVDMILEAGVLEQEAGLTISSDQRSLSKQEKGADIVALPTDDFDSLP
jgi:UDP-3-O-[3-hydroxymyristoyl] N-acetylglucosamine deacetylase/3-hydroxyacyl-[acyl-carrier-protein] dehydratase